MPKKEEVIAKKDAVVTVVREGSKIIIPEDMSYNDARTWLTRQEQAEEALVNVSHQFVCYPLDGVVALNRAMETIYGFTNLPGKTGWWGMLEPPVLVQVPLADGTFATAPISRVSVPAWEGGFLEPHLGQNRLLILGGQIKKKFEKQVKDVISETESVLRTQSIYKGQAMKVDLSWLDGNVRFDPVKSAPKFIMGLKEVTEESIILNDTTKFEVATNLYTLIERTEACVKNKIPLRHGVLLAGTYGTGKTLLSKVVAAKCVPNNWTFIYLENVNHIAECLAMAEMYAPAVVFAEDIDRVMTGDRNEEMNKILNILDGMDTKGKPIITVLTTNAPEKIEPAFMRAGRMDTVIALAYPDAKAAQKFVHLYAQNKQGDSLLAPDVDMKEVGESMADTSPAFIAESIHKAKRHAIYRTGNADITGQVTTEDLVLAGQAMKKHIAMAQQRTTKTEAEQLMEASELMGKAFEGRLREGNGGSPFVNAACPECGENFQVRK